MTYDFRQMEVYFSDDDDRPRPPIGSSSSVRVGGQPTSDTKPAATITVRDEPSTVPGLPGHQAQADYSRRDTTNGPDGSNDRLRANLAGAARWLTGRLAPAVVMVTSPGVV